MFAAAQDLECLCVIVDYNKWQATARSNETLRLSPLREKWQSFGWDAHEVDGHDIEALCEVLSSVPNRSARPVAVVAHTIKGKGVSFMPHSSFVARNTTSSSSRLEFVGDP